MSPNLRRPDLATVVDYSVYDAKPPDKGKHWRIVVEGLPEVEDIETHKRFATIKHYNAEDLPSVDITHTCNCAMASLPRQFRNDYVPTALVACFRIYGLTVPPELRRLGIGDYLLEIAKRIASGNTRSNGCRHAALFLDPEPYSISGEPHGLNLNGLRGWYGRRGFSEFPQHPVSMWLLSAPVQI